MTWVLLVIHIAVLGYWLGSEFVINSTYRYISWSATMPFKERDRLMSHVMDVDQHVRYALILQVGLGTALAALYGFLPGGEVLAWFAIALAATWLVFVEVAHRLRATPMGRKLETIDRTIRYLAMIALLGLALSAMAGVFQLPTWLAWKFICFAGVIACGLGIRFALMEFFRTWAEIARDGSNEARERSVRQTYFRATTVLICLWLFNGAIVWLSVWKPV
jgi:hypothetical protein